MGRLLRSPWFKTGIGAAMVGLYLFPVYWMVATSLKSSHDTFATPPKLLPIPIDFTAYAEEVVGNPVLISVIANSLIISIGTMVLTLLLAAPAAYALARLNLRGSRLMLLFMLVGQLLPSIVIAGPLALGYSTTYTMRRTL